MVDLKAVLFVELLFHIQCIHDGTLTLLTNFSSAIAVLKKLYAKIPMEVNPRKNMIITTMIL